MTPEYEHPISSSAQITAPSDRRRYDLLLPRRGLHVHHLSLGYLALHVQHLLRGGYHLQPYSIPDLPVITRDRCDSMSSPDPILSRCHLPDGRLYRIRLRQVPLYPLRLLAMEDFGVSNGRHQKGRIITRSTSKSGGYIPVSHRRPDLV